MFIPLLINTSIEINLMSARYGGSQGDNCVRKYDKDTKSLKRCCDGKFNLASQCTIPLFLLLEKL